MKLLALTILAFFSSGSTQNTQFCRNVGCCFGRKDDCSRVLSETSSCYCDEFCVENRQLRKSRDCCSDYESRCRRPQPSEPLPFVANLTCYDRVSGKFFKQGEELLINCNKCTCSNVDPDMNIACERDECMVEEGLIDEINRRRLGWRAGRTEEFWGEKLKYGLKSRSGTLSFKRQVARMNPKYVRVSDNLPETFDSRERWPGFIREAENQGSCGASWAFSTVSVASDRWAIATKGEFTDGLSARHLFACSKNQQMCDGGYVTRSWTFIKRNGLLPNRCLKWSSPKGRTCDFLQPSRKAKDAACPDEGGRADLRRMGPAYRVAGEREIMTEIYTNGPVQAIINMDRDLFLYKSGIFTCQPKKGKNLYHSVKIIGWGESNGSKYWLVVNSWGRFWGENGLFRIVRGRNECLIESFVIGSFTQGASKNSNPLYDAK